jgi:hypothetical protein
VSFPLTSGTPAQHHFGAGPTLRKQPGSALVPESPDVQKTAWPTFVSQGKSPPTRFR